jgi:hypothetical protein
MYLFGDFNNLDVLQFFLEIQDSGGKTICTSAIVSFWIFNH